MIPSGPLGRCPWAERSAVERDYHDREWGVPTFDDQALFMWLVLEGAQAGLSWRTILEKRAAYERAFAGFDPVRVAQFGADEEVQLLNDAGIVRNRLKIRSAILNARALVRFQQQEGRFSDYLWSVVGGHPLRTVWLTADALPTMTLESQRLSRALKAKGFHFVGPIITYSFMQATGLVDDHIRGCYRASAV